MIVFGGGLGFSSPCTNEVRVLTDASGAGGTPSWSLLITGGPAPRFGHSVVYDPTTNKLIVFGGSNCFTTPSFGDVWVLSNANGLGGAPVWTQLFPSGSTPFRTAHTAVYDDASNRLIVFGGASAPGVGGGVLSNEVWVLTDANGIGTPQWIQLLPAPGPAARLNHTAVYDAAANQMIVFGGQNPGLANDVWVLSNANGLAGTPTWTQLFPSGGPPLVRLAHTAVFDQATKRMTVFGGLTCDPGGCTNLNDVWVLTDAFPTPAVATQNLIDDINSLGLASGVQTSLIGPLNQATTILEDDNPNNDAAACGKLGAFINQVNAKEKSGKLTSGEADELIQSAEAIEDSLGCP